MSTNEKTITIRRAVAHDFVSIMKLLEQAVQENEVAYPAIDPFKIMQWIGDTKRDGEILVAEIGSLEKGSRLVGCIGMTVQFWKWSQEQFIGNEFMFVLPAFRKHGTFDKMIEAAEHFADKGNLRLVIGFSGGHKSDVKDRMMMLRGYHYSGGTFHRLASAS